MRNWLLVIVFLVGGCASVERHQMRMTPKPKAEVIAPVVTPNDQVKHRWYDRFKKHPHFFHQ